ncbi:hypothetical protein B484DRAFT_440647 [Ochromonadaceae sp. CCMP2298]|nr:hypothetical protein B484DRAFT_440647 [Ochromonadaceae sp. CCMP2298]
MDTPPPPSNNKRAWFHTAPTASNMRAAANMRASSAITPAQASPTQAQVAPPEEDVVVTKQPRLGESNQFKPPRQRAADEVQQKKDLILNYRKMLDIADELHGSDPSDDVILKLDKSFQSMVEPDDGRIKVEVMHYLDLKIKRHNTHHFEFARTLTTTNARSTKTTEFVFQMPTSKANQILPFILHSSNGGISLVGATVRLPVRCEVYAKQTSSRWIITVHIPEEYGGDTFVISKTDLIQGAVDDTIGEYLV